MMLPHCALWFDVGVKRYTTEDGYKVLDPSCGLK